MFDVREANKELGKFAQNLIHDIEDHLRCRLSTFLARLVCQVLTMEQRTVSTASPAVKYCHV